MWSSVNLAMSTPHARGSTCKERKGETKYEVYPACAGIHPPDLSVSSCRVSLPRMRGDPPQAATKTNKPKRSTPHARGSTALISSCRRSKLSTPHARGSTVWRRSCGAVVIVYPACAGIHPPGHPALQPFLCLPRMRGDPPVVANSAGPPEASTPHARGSTPASCSGRGSRKVYPACAGIHPLSIWLIKWLHCLPRMRGDPPERS